MKKILWIVVLGFFLITNLFANTWDIKEQKDGSYLIDASISVREVNKRLGWDLPLSGPKTLNGLILENTETIPEANISLEIENYLIETVLIKDNMIKFTKVRKLKSPDLDEEDLD